MFAKTSFMLSESHLIWPTNHGQKFQIQNKSLLWLFQGQIDIKIINSLGRNYGENIKNHGYGVLNLEDFSYTFKDLENPQPFLSFKITDITDIEKEKEILVND